MRAGCVLRGCCVNHKLREILRKCGSERDPLFLRIVIDVEELDEFMPVWIFVISFLNVVVLVDEVEKDLEHHMSTAGIRIVKQASRMNVLTTAVDADPSVFQRMVDDTANASAASNKLPSANIIEALASSIIALHDDQTRRVPKGSVEALATRMLDAARCPRDALQLLVKACIDYVDDPELTRLVARAIVERIVRFRRPLHSTYTPMDTLSRRIHVGRNTCTSRGTRPRSG